MVSKQDKGKGRLKNLVEMIMNDLKISNLAEEIDLNRTELRYET